MKKYLLLILSVFFVNALSAQLSGTATCGIFTYSYTITPVSCGGTCDGSITITALSGGTPAYFYNWSPGSPIGDGTPTISGLCAGAYSVMFTDAGGVSCVASFVLNNGTPISFTIVTTNVSCYGICDGTLCVTGETGGSAPYSYIWVPSGNTTPCVTAACPGTYTVCVTDANGCMACSNAVITEPPPITVVESVVNSSCFGCCDGAASIATTGGTAGYTYLWSTGDITPSVFGLCAGVYNYCVTDGNGCTSCDTVEISFSSGIFEQGNNAFSIFPNPGKGDFEIRSSGSATELNITDVSGKLVMQKKLDAGEKKIAIQTDLESGIYFLFLEETGKTRTSIEKLIIQK